jgi:hypothetical protein
MGTRMGTRMICSRGREAVGGFARFGVLFMVLFIIAAHRDGSPYHRLDERCGEVGRGVPAEPGWWGMLNRIVFGLAALDEDRDEDGDKDGDKDSSAVAGGGDPG